MPRQPRRSLHELGDVSLLFFPQRVQGLRCAVLGLGTQLLMRVQCAVVHLWRAERACRRLHVLLP